MYYLVPTQFYSVAYSILLTYAFAKVQILNVSASSQLQPVFPLTLVSRVGTEIASGIENQRLPLVYVHVPTPTRLLSTYAYLSTWREFWPTESHRLLRAVSLILPRNPSTHPT
jgi:hypothetical protein